MATYLDLCTQPYIEPAMEEQRSQHPVCEFAYFTHMPLEIQLMVWELTLPNIKTVRIPVGGNNRPLTTQWPIIETPEPPTRGDLYGRLPLMGDPPLPHGIPAALHVCRTSRELALKYFAPLRHPVSGYSPEPVIRYRPPIHQLGFFGIDDIVDINNPWIPVKRLGRRYGRRTQSFDNKLRHLTASLDLSFHVDDDFEVKGGKLMYDMESDRLCALVGPSYLRTDYLSTHVVVRASSAEQWAFGSRLAIGHVPEILRELHGEEPGSWLDYNTSDAQKIYIHGAYPVFSNPSQILVNYIWLLHKMVSGSEHSNAECCRPDTMPPDRILGNFIAIMDRGRCPVCRVPLIPTIEKHHPGLSLERLDVLFVIPNYSFSAAERETQLIRQGKYWQARIGTAWTEIVSNVIRFLDQLGTVDSDDDEGGDHTGQTPT